MSDLLFTRSENLLMKSGKDIDILKDSLGLVSINSMLIDRTETIPFPYSFYIPESSKVPNISNTNIKSFDDCCNENAINIINLSKKLNKKIALLYSGGIDSTTVIISFLKNMSVKEFTEQVIIFMNVESIRENYNFYYSVIRPLGNTMSSHCINNLLNGKFIVVNGDYGDQIFGSDIYGLIHRWGSWDRIHTPYTRDNITSIFNAVTSQHFKYANIWYDLFDFHISQHAPQVYTVAEFLWWIDFIFHWQAVHCLDLLHINKNIRTSITGEFLNDHYHQFFSTKDFQRWSLSTPSYDKLGKSFKTYKQIMKDFIYSYYKDELYKNNKVKIGSKGRLFMQQDIATGLTADYKFIDNNIDYNKYYQSSNIFTEK